MDKWKNRTTRFFSWFEAGLSCSSADNYFLYDALDSVVCVDSGRKYMEMT